MSAETITSIISFKRTNFQGKVKKIVKLQDLYIILCFSKHLSFLAFNKLACKRSRGIFRDHK